MVPASIAYQHYPSRSGEHSGLPSPVSVAGESDGRRSYESHVPDVATVPEHNQGFRLDLCREIDHQNQQRSPVQSQAAMPVSQDYRPAPAVGMHVPFKTNAAIRGYPLYGHGYYPAEQGVSHGGEAEAAGQYVVHPLTHPSLHSHAAAIPEHSSHQQRSYHHHGGNTAEWSQYPLFSYPCW